jgi:TonB family protein
MMQQGNLEVLVSFDIQPSGQVTNIQILQSSGYPKYDNEAVRAIRDSSPFTNPPPEHINSRGVLTLKWGFRVFR